MAETTALAALMRSIEKLETERAGLAEQLAAIKDEEASQKTLRNVSLEQVKTFLRNLRAEDMTRGKRSTYWWTA